MSRRAASIEPEDGECTPSPSAVQQAQNAAKYHATAPPPVMQALPPPPPAAPARSDGRYQVKVCVFFFLAATYLLLVGRLDQRQLFHLASSMNHDFSACGVFCC